MYELTEYESAEKDFFVSLYTKLNQELTENNVSNSEDLCKKIIKTVGMHLDKTDSEIIFKSNNTELKCSEGYMMCHHDNASEAMFSLPK